MLRKRIEVSKSVRDCIIETLGCSGEAVRSSLLLDKDTPLARAIRRDALALGARVVVEAPIEEVLTIEGDYLVWDRGNRKATIDLASETIILNEGDEQEKEIVLTIENLIALIKEAKK